MTGTLMLHLCTPLSRSWSFSLQAQSADLGVSYQHREEHSPQLFQWELQHSPSPSAETTCSSLSIFTSQGVVEVLEGSPGPQNTGPNDYNG